MNRGHNKDTQKALLLQESKLSTVVKHGSQSFEGFNPRAPSFVPSGPGFAKGARQESHAATHSGGKDAAALGKSQAYKGSQEDSSSKEGALSRAFRSKGQTSKQQVAPHRPPPQQPAVNAEMTPLGRSPSRKFVAANHLLNLQYDSRAAGRTSGAQGRGRGGRRGTPRVQPYDRNKFLQANFRFLVSDAADLRAYAADADLMLDWSDVLEVEMLVPAPLRCPISLESPPLCPQITPCGHVFSFPAIMAHLLTHGGDALRKASPCPLCTAPIVARELRLVRAHIVKPPEVGNEVAFTLLKRPRNSIIPKEVSASAPSMESSHADAEAAAAAWGSRQVPASRSSDVGQTGNGRTGVGSAPLAERADREAGTQALGEYNRFAKFTVVPDPAPLWAAAAVQLSDYAAQVTAEGGTDAAQEAPYIFAALDALAGRAASWAERRQRILMDQGSLDGVSSSNAGSSTPQEAAAAAAAAVKRISTAAVQSAAEQRSKQATEQERLRSFPSLAGGSSRVSPGSGLPPAPSPIQASHVSASREQNFEAAFSDEGSPKVEDAHQGAGTAQEGAVCEDERNVLHEGTMPGQASGLPQPPASEFYFFQATDGQWLFLHPLLMRILLAHHGSYEALPHGLSGRLLEVEPQVQTEALRKRHKFLGHLPLGGAYAQGEIDLTQSLPQEALAPFSKELAARSARREARAAEEARQDARDAARAETERRRAAGPSVSELLAMPLPGRRGSETPHMRSESAEVDEAVALSFADLEDGTTGWVQSPPPDLPQSGVSFSHMAKMGFAASGPALSSTPPNPQAPVWPVSASRNTTPNAASSPLGRHLPWGTNIGTNGEHGSKGTLASRLAEAEAARQNPKEPEAPASHSKGKKGKQLVVLGMQNRRY